MTDTDSSSTLTGRILRSRWMFLWLGILAFLENTILLIPMEPLFIPIMAAQRKRAPLIAAVLVAGCLAGALATYVLANALYEPVVAPFLEQMGLTGDLERVQGDIEEGGFLAMFLVGLTPVPFQLGTVAAGIVGLSLPVFIAAVVISRGIRYGFLAVLTMWIGHRAERFIEDNELWILIGFVVLFLVMAGATVLL